MKQNQLAGQTIINLKTGESNVVSPESGEDIRDLLISLDNGKTRSVYLSIKSESIRFADESIQENVVRQIKSYDNHQLALERAEEAVARQKDLEARLLFATWKRDPIMQVDQSKNDYCQKGDYKYGNA